MGSIRCINNYITHLQRIMFQKYPNEHYVMIKYIWLKFICVFANQIQFHLIVGHTLRMGRIFDSYSKFRIFERFPAIQFKIQKLAAI